MNPTRKNELLAMQAHEDWISRPVRELFGDDLKARRSSECRHCGVTFLIPPTSNRSKCYCSATCKDHYRRRHDR